MTDAPPPLTAAENIASVLANEPEVLAILKERDAERARADQQAKDYLGAQAAWEAERDKLEARAEALANFNKELGDFKTYVHQRLDEAGIPTHPDGPHSAAGCRIGDRLDIVLGELTALREALGKAVRTLAADYCGCNRQDCADVHFVKPPTLDSIIELRALSGKQAEQ